MIIWCWNVNSAPACTQRDAEPRVAVNGVTENGPFRVIAGESCDADAVQTIESDNIALACTGPADYTVAR
jgi:hypothetical protein